MRISDWSSDVCSSDLIMADRAPRAEDKPRLDTRGFSVLKDVPAVRSLALPGMNGENPRPFEVIGVPLAEPGLHVLEVESARLGQSLLACADPMLVHTTVLLTNLGVHITTGRDAVLAWVPILDDGMVVPQADTCVLNCYGVLLARCSTEIGRSACRGRE